MRLKKMPHLFILCFLLLPFNRIHAQLPTNNNPENQIRFKTIEEAGQRREKLIQFICDNQKEDGSWNNPTSTAFALLVLLSKIPNEKRKIERGIDYLTGMQNSDGSWNPDPIVMTPGNRFYYFQSDSFWFPRDKYDESTAITTAFSVLALDWFINIFSKN